MLEITYQILFLASPLLLVAIAHGFCIKYDWLSGLKRPLDLGVRFRGRRFFGDQKTWRGLVINVVFCTLGTMIQAWLQGKGYLPSWILLLDYHKYRYIVGLLLGLGMTVGELPNSFIKRQLDIPLLSYQALAIAGSMVPPAYPCAPCGYIQCGVSSRDAQNHGVNIRGRNRVVIGAMSPFISRTLPPTIKSGQISPAAQGASLR